MGDDLHSAGYDLLPGTYDGTYKKDWSLRGSKLYSIGVPFQAVP